MKLCVYAVLALLIAVTAHVARAADLTLRFGTPFVTNSNLHKAMEKFAEVVAQESGGKIKVQVATPGTQTAVPHDNTSGAAGAMEHCHKAAPMPGQKIPCKHCNSDGGCTSDACALKCFKLVGDLETPLASLTKPLAGLTWPAIMHASPEWLATLPAPPPRA